MVNDSSCDEWGYISISELAQLQLAKNLPMIEVDIHFQPVRF
ncbi:hypothetical protein IMCC1989_2171 [gamma proteobacterium IMCC1989]|nr:hypothetical protein IMCC1989_2171 [gamma proteobacterium IMCC1989]